MEKFTISEGAAREIMGWNNFFGVDESLEHYGIVIPKEYLNFPKMPFSEEILKDHRNTHILTAVLSVPIVYISKRIAAKFFYKNGSEESWYCDQNFAGEITGSGWWLVRKTPVIGSLSNAWKNQQGLLKEAVETTPPARVVIYAMVGHCLLSGYRMFEEVFVRTGSVNNPEGRRVIVGYFDSTGMRISLDDDHRPVANVGLSSAICIKKNAL